MTARHQKLTQFANGREDLLIPVSTLCIESRLFHLNDLAILGEYTVGELRQHRPSRKTAIDREAMAVSVYVVRYAAGTKV